MEPDRKFQKLKSHVISPARGLAARGTKRKGKNIIHERGLFLHVFINR